MTDCIITIIPWSRTGSEPVIRDSCTWYYSRSRPRWNNLRQSISIRGSSHPKWRQSLSANHRVMKSANLREKEEHGMSQGPRVITCYSCIQIKQTKTSYYHITTQLPSPFTKIRPTTHARAHISTTQHTQSFKVNKNSNLNCITFYIESDTLKINQYSNSVTNPEIITKTSEIKDKCQTR